MAAAEHAINASTVAEVLYGSNYWRGAGRIKRANGVKGRQITARRSALLAHALYLATARRRTQIRVYVST